jgi:hypothetical protein
VPLSILNGTRYFSINENEYFQSCAPLLVLLHVPGSNPHQYVLEIAPLKLCRADYYLVRLLALSVTAIQSTRDIK